jgi:tryptophanyl-tRNA synthetase
MRPIRGWTALLILGFFSILFGGGLVLSERALASDEGMEDVSPGTEALKMQWDQLDPDMKERLIERYREWKQMPPERREAIRRNLERFNALSEEEKKKIRERYRAFRMLPPEEKREILANYDRWLSMTPEERERLREKYRNYIQQLSPEERTRLRDYYRQNHRLPPSIREKLRDRP